MFYLAFILIKLNKEIEPIRKIALGFNQAFIQQFANPKAWIMVIAGASVFMPQLNNIHLNVFIFASIFGLVGIPNMFVWIKMGDTISKILKSEKSNRILGYTMFSLMMVSIITIWIK
jgi:threonine/homoserine/homoserine lactone efflux protein